MTNLEAIKQAKLVLASYKEAQTEVEAFIANDKDPDMIKVAIIKYMQVLGKESPEQMAEAKNLFAELENM